MVFTLAFYSLRVNTNGFGFVLVLFGALNLAWFAPNSALWLKNIFSFSISNFIIAMIFLMQGWKLKPNRLFEVFADGFSLWVIQLIILAGPISFVLGGWALGLLDAQLLEPLLFLACLPTTISSCVVFTRAAAGDGDYALGHATLSNLIAPFFVPVAWFFLIRPNGTDGIAVGNALLQVIPDLLLLVALPCWLGWALRRKFSQKSYFILDWIARNVPLGGIAILAYLSLGLVVLELGVDKCIVEIKFLLLPVSILYISVAILSWFLSGWIRRDRGGRMATFFCLSQKSLAMGIPLVHLLVGIDEPLLYVWLFPIIIFHFIQLLAGAFLIRIFR